MNQSPHRVLEAARPSTRGSRSSRGPRDSRGSHHSTDTPAPDRRFSVRRRDAAGDRRTARVAGPSRRAVLASASTLALGAGLAGCMRLATDENAGSFAPSIEAVDLPNAATPHENARVGATIVNEGVGTGTTTVSVRLDGQRVDGESITLEGGAETTVAFDVTPTAAGDRDLAIVVEESGADGERDETDDTETDGEPGIAAHDLWRGTLAVGGLALELEWEETFVPAEAVAGASDTRHLAFACFALELWFGVDTVERYAIGDDAISFASGAYPAEPITDGRLEAFDGETGRWLGTGDGRTDLVIDESVPVAEALTLELHGYSPLERETAVTARVDGERIDTGVVPARSDGESWIVVELEGAFE